MFLNKEYDSMLIARYILYIAKQNDVYMNFTKTHKILYIFDGMSLLLHDRVFSNERPNAWPYGPAYPKVQYMMKRIPLKDLGNCEPLFFQFINHEEINFLVYNVLMMFGDYTSDILCKWSYKKGSPWWTTRKERNNDCNAVIHNNVIKDYFENIFPNIEEHIIE